MTRRSLDTSHSTVDLEPAYSQWAALVGRGVAWTGGSEDLETRRRRSRTELLALAHTVTDAWGISHAPARGVDAPIVITGHQPLIYHLGIQAKSFVLNHIAEKTSSTAIDIVVDTDVEHEMTFQTPRFAPEPQRMSLPLMRGDGHHWFADTQPPTETEVEVWSQHITDAVGTLGLPEVSSSVDRYLTGAAEAAAEAGDAAEFSVRARRKFEDRAGLDHLQLPVSRMIESCAWGEFITDIVSEAARFHESYNDALAEFRVRHHTRSAAQPFHDLRVQDGLIELPLWYLHPSGRIDVFVRPGVDGSWDLVAGGEVVYSETADGTIEDAKRGHFARLAPKAITLTLFLRVWFCELFIHGTGGYRYDEVCDSVAHSFYRCEPAARVSATCSAYLPLVAQWVDETSLSEAVERIHRVAHHPEEFIEEADLGDWLASQAADLLAEKDGLVLAIKAPGADKKSMGLRIKAINAELAQILEPHRGLLEVERRALEQSLGVQRIIADRTHSFPLFDPLEMAAFIDGFLD